MLDTLIRDALTKNTALTNAGDAAEFTSKANASRNAVLAVNQALVELASMPGLLASYYIALKQANENVIGQLQSDGHTFTEAEMTPAKVALNAFEAAAKEFTKKKEELSIAWKAEPFLPKSERLAVGIIAIALFALAMLFAAKGDAKTWPAGITISYWCGFGSFALAVVWVVSGLAVPRPAMSSAGSARPGSYLQYLVFGGMAFLILGLLVAGVLTGGLLEFLSSIQGARGLITFLIAIGTIAIAVILTLASVLMETDGIDALKERLSKGKEILTVLVGVLGTIVGFYFAHNPDDSPGGKVTVAVVAVPNEVTVGEEFEVLAMTTGGTLPYDATPVITVGGKGVTGEGTVNEQGLIKVKFKVADDATAGPISLVVGVRDKTGKTASAKSDVIVKKP
ncbi:MAG: hypothetical protein JSS49_27945 [Planctomycetes bacterium]|nr:hypothetical protein [Planctomycetota bacterium]